MTDLAGVTHEIVGGRHTYVVNGHRYHLAAGFWHRDGKALPLNANERGLSYAKAKHEEIIQHMAGKLAQLTKAAAETTGRTQEDTVKDLLVVSEAIDQADREARAKLRKLDRLRRRKQKLQKRARRRNR